MESKLQGFILIDHVGFGKQIKLKIQRVFGYRVLIVGI